MDSEQQQFYLERSGPPSACPEQTEDGLAELLYKYQVSKQ